MCKTIHRANLVCRSDKHNLMKVACACEVTVVFQFQNFALDARIVTLKHLMFLKLLGIFYETPTIKYVFVYMYIKQ